MTLTDIITGAAIGAYVSMAIVTTLFWRVNPDTIRDEQPPWYESAAVGVLWPIMFALFWGFYHGW